MTQLLVWVWKSHRLYRLTLFNYRLDLPLNPRRNLKSLSVKLPKKVLVIRGFTLSNWMKNPLCSFKRVKDQKKSAAQMCPYLCGFKIIWTFSMKMNTFNSYSKSKNMRVLTWFVSYTNMVWNLLIWSQIVKKWKISSWESRRFKTLIK